MTKDLNANITRIQYNCLNLPKRILFTNRHVMDYVYNADGELLQMSARAQHQLPRPRLDTKYYVGNVVYFPGKLSLLTDEGYVTFASNGTPTYHYYLKDHLGNVRVVFNQTGTVEQRNDYYPSGALMATSTGGSVQPYKYNGKELVRTDHFDHYDYGARWMNPKIGARFTTIDPMCEEYYDISPYAYCAGDPVNLMDLDGRHIYTINENGEIKKISNDSHMDLLISYDGLDMAKFSFGFLEQFTSERDDYKGHYGNTSNLDDAVSLFMFAAKNTDVEWAISSYYQNNEKLDYLVYTSHSEDGVTFTNGNHKFKNIHAHIHSHPRGTGNDKASGDYSQMNNGQKEYRSFGSDDLSFINGKYIEYMKIYPNKDFYRDYPKFYIYNARTNKLFRYDHRNPYIPVK